MLFYIKERLIDKKDVYFRPYGLKYNIENYLIIPKEQFTVGDFFGIRDGYNLFLAKEITYNHNTYYIIDVDSKKSILYNSQYLLQSINNIDTFKKLKQYLEENFGQLSCDNEKLITYLDKIAIKGINLYMQHTEKKNIKNQDIQYLKGETISVSLVNEFYQDNKFISEFEKNKNIEIVF